MDHIIQFLLIGLISTIISKVESEFDIKQYVKQYSKDDGMNIINSNQHYLKVSNLILHESESFLMYKGTYDDGIPVAIKITAVEVLFDDEMLAYEALRGDRAKLHGIPNVYYSGNVFNGKCKAIAMSLFEETVEQRYTKQSTGISKPLSDFSILFIFEQAVKTLKYLHLRHVCHNDIKPQNILLRNKKVFIANFHLATLNEIQRGGHTSEYASSNRFAERYDSCAMDDLESLIFSMWHIAGFNFSKPYGSLLLNEKTKNTARSWMKEICKHFKLKTTQYVFADICIKELLSGGKIPKYDRILKLLSFAIEKVMRTTQQTQFEWLPEFDMLEG